MNSFSKNLVILRYHSVKKNPNKHDHLIAGEIIHSEMVFRSQMDILARKYNPISMDHLVDALSGSRPLEKRSVLVTFDDGYADNAEIVASILNHYDIPGTFYLTVDAIDSGMPPWYVRLRFLFWQTAKTEWLSPINSHSYTFNGREARLAAFIDHCRLFAAMDSEKLFQITQLLRDSLNVDEEGAYDNVMMKWSQARQLIDEGHIIGSHSMTHPNLTFIDRNGALKEISDSKSVLENKLGVKINHFCYPNPALVPNYNSETSAIIKKCNYSTAVTSESGCVNISSDYYELSRLSAPFCLIDFCWYLDSTFCGRIM